MFRVYQTFQELQIPVYVA